MMAWRAPNPPFPEYGIELNFGLDDQGSGEVQPETPASVTNSEELEQEEQVEVTVQDAQEAVEDIKPVPESVQDAGEPVSKQESPVTVKESKPAEVKPVERAEEKPVQAAVKKIVEEENKRDKADEKPVDIEDSGGKKPANHGDDVKAVGDKGSPEGTLDAKALYGNAGGGGGGVGLDLAGWEWDQIPRPQIPGNESDGKIEFEIKVDENGDIIGYRVLERSLSIAAEKACRDAISKLTFSKKPGAVVPAVSVGKLTFVVRTR